MAECAAALQGCQAATLAPSTLHLSWDVFGMVAGLEAALFVDSGVYAVARWGVERAAARGVPVRWFDHHDSLSLDRELRHSSVRGRFPVVVTDGFCTGCGAVAPIHEHRERISMTRGIVLVDDTQAFGILGHSPSAAAPYGLGGGGSLRWLGASGDNVLLLTSLAKAFGAPLALLSGSATLIERFELHSETRRHCSPPSIAALRAATRALEVNAESGDDLRGRLHGLVRQFREGLLALELPATGGDFPVQALSPVPGLTSRDLHGRLRRLGVRALLQEQRGRQGGCITFLITASHTPESIARCLQALERIKQAATPGRIARRAARKR